MSILANKIPVVDRCTPELFFAEIAPLNQPVVLKNIVAHWALVKAGRESDEQAVAHIKSFYNGRPVGASFGQPEIKGRFFYNQDATELNFEKRQMRIDEALDEILVLRSNPTPPSLYIGSTSLEGFFPQLRSANNLDHYFDLFNLEKGNLLESIWIGNRTTASCHYDAPYNIACCVAGKRRATLFPPEQINNLYPGPLDLTPGGQAVSMVDFQAPDFAKHPRFREAIAAGQYAELEPGDAIYIPSMWWHHIEALNTFNILINYWYRQSALYMGTPMNTLKYALLSLRNRPENEKRAWQAVFDYYVFADSGLAGEHLPEAARGLLGPMDDLKARQLRAFLINSLNR
ncbi:MAG: cupin-like domain-containing protein [Pseudomonadota bacterium]